MLQKVCKVGGYTAEACSIFETKERVFVIFGDLGGCRIV